MIMYHTQKEINNQKHKKKNNDVNVKLNSCYFVSSPMVGVNILKFQHTKKLCDGCWLAYFV